MTQEEEDALVERLIAVLQPTRCPRFLALEDPCDGLEGCDACLDLAARAALGVFLE